MSLHSSKSRSFSVSQIIYPPATELSKIILGALVFAETIVSVFWIFTLSGLGEGYALMAAVPYAYIIISYTTLLIFYRYKRYEYFTFTQLVMLLVMPFFMQWVIGGFEASSGIAIWAILSPVGALLIIGYRQSLPWFALFVILVGISWQLNTTFAANALPIPRHIKDIYFAMNLLGTATILYGVMSYFQSQKELVMASLAEEQKKSEKLLLNILPESVAYKLKNNDFKTAKDHEAVTIMFADMVNFTEISAGMHASALIHLLNQVFTRFDDLTEKYGVEKIKTIGDSYMVVSGAPEARSDHAEVMANMALEINHILTDISATSGKNLMMRVGINSGPVVAGVIGSRKFSYDLWGDTVNMASRMEQCGLPGHIQVTMATYELLKDKYQFECRGEIDVKGKGFITTYFLNGPIPT
jgi:guanylate cyclase